jgi:putative spermidine/putrescine transport system ATP-binding protein
MAKDAGAGEPMVRFENVQKSYDGETLVVKDLNLDIAKGEFLTMLGPSGSGKTTTLMMLAGFEPATTARFISTAIRSTTCRRTSAASAWCSRTTRCFRICRWRRTWRSRCQVRGMSKAEQEERVKKVLEMVELAQMGGRRPAQLSGGQQQRVAVARALVFEPDLVLMDEPLGALDKQLREQMQYEIKHIHESLGVTVVYVTHDQSEALTMSDRVAVFEDGIIQQLSTPEELYERPLNSFVAQFIGENNKLRGTVQEIGRDKIATVKLDSGDLVKALAVNVDGKGERTLLSIRPERVTIAPKKTRGTITLDGRVEELIYLGDHIRTRMSVAGHPDFIVKVPNNAGHHELKEGQTTTVGWQAEDCRALDDMAA